VSARAGVLRSSRPPSTPACFARRAACSHTRAAALWCSPPRRSTAGTVECASGKGQPPLPSANSIDRAHDHCGTSTSSRTHESTGEYVDDSAITAKVKAAILEDPELKTLQISVKTFKGVVQLSGFVDSKEMVARAGEVAGQVSGVREVKNDLIVK
jgi:hypothetical protein